MRLVDTHCHLNDTEAYPDPLPLIEEALEAGVERMVVVGVDTLSSELAVNLAEQHACLWAAVGWHPNYAHGFDADALAAVSDLAQHPKVVAIGEVGLDNHWDYASPQQQQVALEAQLDLAQSLGKPVVLHCREAYAELLEVVERRGKATWVFHCFAGTESDAKRVVALGGYLGVDGPVTYKKNDELRALLKEVPSDRLLIETDCPWLAPIPYRGKPNRPAWLTHVNIGVAHAIGIEPDACAEITTANAERVFGWSAA